MKEVILVSLRLAVAAFSFAGLAYAQDVATATQASPVADIARASTASTSTPESEPADLTGMLAAHNQVRTRLGLQPLMWSTNLADAARATARTASQGACTMASTDKAVRGLDVSLHWVSSLRRLGGMDTLQDISPGYVVSRWLEGSATYDVAGDGCRDGSSQCAAYARIVTPANNVVGCARLVCPSQAQIWTCRYRK